MEAAHNFAVVWVINFSFKLVSLNTWFSIGGDIGEVMEPFQCGVLLEKYFSEGRCGDLYSHSTS